MVAWQTGYNQCRVAPAAMRFCKCAKSGIAMLAYLYPMLLSKKCSVLIHENTNQQYILLSVYLLALKRCMLLNISHRSLGYVCM